MTLSIKNGGYAFVIRLDLMVSMSSSKEFQLLQILNNLFIKYLIKLISYENDVKLLKFMRRPVYLLLNPSSKMTKRFYNIARTQLAQVSLYTRKDFKSLGIGSLYAK